MIRNKEAAEVFPGIPKSLRRLDEDKLSVLIGALIVVLGSWAFINLAHEVAIGATQRFDEMVMRSLRKPNDLSIPIGPVWLHEVGQDFTALGGYSVLVLVVVLVTGFLQLDGKRGATRFVAGAAVSGYLVAMGLKALFQRARPTVVPHLVSVYDSSFPSAHAMMSAVVYLTLGVLLARLATNLPRVRNYFVLVPLLLTGLVGASRVYLGVHYPTDVLAGWTAGVVWATLCSLVARRLQRRGVIETGL